MPERVTDVAITEPLHDEALGVRHSTVTFADAQGGSVPALLIQPGSERATRSVLSFHFGGRQTHDALLRDGAGLAAAGFATLFVHAPWLRPGGDRVPHRLHAFALFDQAGAELLRAAEVLATLPGLDHDRIGFVGHGFGAQLGALVTARSAEVRAAVLIAGSPRMSRQMLTDHPFWNDGAAIGADELREASARMERLDAERFIRHSRMPVLLQFATHDPFVSAEEAREFVALTPDPKVVRFYEGDHGVRDPRALPDRVAFLDAALDRTRTERAETSEDRRALSGLLEQQLPPQ